MKILHMETDSVRSITSSFNLLIGILHDQGMSMKRSVQGTDWIGLNRDEFLNEIDQVYLRLGVQLEAGSILSKRVEAEVNEWEDLDAKHLNEMKCSTAVIIQKASQDFPTNLRELAGKVNKYYGETYPDVQIVKIGTNQYLVLLPGTKGGNQWNNWGGAGVAGMGIETPFERQINQLIINKIPAGATINFAGHSQGGILAQNLVEHQSDASLKGYNFGTIYTFGSPESAYKVQKVNIYSNTELFGDPVPLLDQSMMNPVGIPIALGAGLGFAGGHQFLGMDIKTTHVDMYSQVISKEDLKFTVSEWTVVGSDYANVATSGLAGFETALHSGDPLRIVVDGLFEIPRGTVLALGSMTSNTIELLCPPDIAKNVDHFSEDSLRYISEFDEVQLGYNINQAAATVGGELVNLANNAASVVGNTANLVGVGVTNIANGLDYLVGSLF